MVSSAITPTRTIAVLIGVAVIAVAGFAVVRSGVFEPETVQGAMPGPGSSSPSASPSPSESPTALPTPTASPKPTTPAQIKAKNIADAKARLVEYYATTATVANNGYKDWRQTLVPFWGSFEIRDAMSVGYTQSAKDRIYTTGAAQVESTRSTSYTPSDNGYEEVAFDACVDFGNVRTFDNAGEEIARESGAPTRYRLDYLMRHEGPGGLWTIEEEERHVGRAC